MKVNFGNSLGHGQWSCQVGFPGHRDVGGMRVLMAIGGDAAGAGGTTGRGTACRAFLAHDALKLFQVFDVLVGKTAEDETRRTLGIGGSQSGSWSCCRRRSCENNFR